MNKRAYIIIVGAFLFFFALNYLMPLAFGDDYLYAFVCQGNPMYFPLAEDSVKISSLQDLIASQISFYYTWSGRVVNNTLSQLFAWLGKDVFNIFNAFACVLLVLEMYWCANKGRVTFNFDSGLLSWLFLFFWVFTPGFPSVVLGMVGACHYLWPAVFLTGFLIPYICKYYSFKKNDRSILFSCGMFLFGVIAGCTNENSVCWIILLLSVLCFYLKNRKVDEVWMFTGLTGLFFGYAMLMLSPGNYVRLIATHDSSWFNQAKFLENLHVFAIVLVIQFLLWYFCLRSLFLIYSSSHGLVATEKKKIKKELVLVKALCVTAIGMSIIMLFSPEFHLRSAFPGTVQLIIVTGIIIRIQKEYSIELLCPNAKSFFIYIGIIYFAITAVVTFYHAYNRHIYDKQLLKHVVALKATEKKTILKIEAFPKSSEFENALSGYHAFDMNVTPDVDSWVNVSFARYYGIKGIRLLNTEDAIP